MSVKKFADENTLRQNIEETKEYVNRHGGSGHSIVNSSGTAVTQRYSLQFKKLDVSDDSTNEKTVVTGADLTPVGAIISMAHAKTGDVSGISTPTGAFPNTDYLVCDGEQYNVSSYPLLASYIARAYGSSNYFGGNGSTTFNVPDFTADFPTNGVLCIKATIVS